MRDIEADYKAAYLSEYTALARTGRTEDAARVAQILRDCFGLEVDGGQEQDAGDPVEVPEPVLPETAAAARPPESAADPKPPVKKTAPARKAAAKKPQADSK